MAIKLAEAEGTTYCECDRCRTVVGTGKADGVAPADWLTGQLWIDVSLSEQKQTPIVFCGDCREAILAANDFTITEDT